MEPALEAGSTANPGRRDHRGSCRNGAGRRDREHRPAESVLPLPDAAAMEPVLGPEALEARKLTAYTAMPPQWGRSLRTESTAYNCLSELTLTGQPTFEDGVPEDAAPDMAVGKMPRWSRPWRTGCTARRIGAVELAEREGVRAVRCCSVGLYALSSCQGAQAGVDLLASAARGWIHYLGARELT